MAGPQKLSSPTCSSASVFLSIPANAKRFPPDIHRDHVGIHDQKQPGLVYVGASVSARAHHPQQLHLAADLADRYADGHVRNTVMQNLLIVNVRKESAARVAAELTAAGLPVQASLFARGTVSCTGSEFCKLALTETKSFARWLTQELEDRLPAFEEQLKLHITGCPNSCGQHWIADIGIEGKKSSRTAAWSTPITSASAAAWGSSLPLPAGGLPLRGPVPDAIERLLKVSIPAGKERENLRQFFARHSNEELRAFLAGNFVEASSATSPGPVPHGVEG